MTKDSNSQGIAPLGGPAAWQGAQLNSDGHWIWHLDAEALQALEAALAATRHLDWHRISRETFPLGAWAGNIEKLAHELEEGRGIVLLRGFPVERYAADDLKRLHFGLACHLGTPIYQSARGELIGEITDEGAAALARGTLKDDNAGEVFLSSRARVQTTGPLRFHSDRCDVVSLLCAQSAASGGESQIVSAIAIHDAMAERRPDLLAELYKDLPRSRLGEEMNGAGAYYLLPVFALEQGLFTTHYSRTYVEAGQKLKHVPRVTDKQWEALDLLQELGYELCLQHKFEPGDIQFLNNHILYHARSAYEDDEQQRLLYRIWLSMPNSRPLPGSHGVLFGATAAGALRGGIRQPDGSNVPAG